MKAVASSVFQTIMFPHKGKIVTIDQVSHYEPNPSTNLDKILPLINTNQDAYPLVEMGLGIFKDPSLLGTYHGAAPLLHPVNQVCVISSNGTHTEDANPPQEASVIPDVSIVTDYSHRSLLCSRRPQTSTNPHPLRGIVPSGRQFPNPSLKFPSFTLHQVSKLFK